MDSGLHSASPPLVFLRPVGLDADDSLRLVQAAKGMSQLVRWRMAPVGVQADVYLAHRANVVYGPAPRRGELGNSGHSSQLGASTSSAYGHTQLYLNDHGWYKNHPVCLLGSADAHETPANAEQLPTLEFPAALSRLRLELERVEREIIGLRAMYALGRTAWEERKRWRSHRLHIIDGARLIAVIEPLHWRIHLLSDAPIAQIELGNAMLVPHSSAFAAPGFDVLPLEQALWEFAKRCPEGLLAQVLPSKYLREPLTHRRVSELSERELGDHCVVILRALDSQSRSADELQTSLRMSRPALLRALGCLALTRAIHPEYRPGGWLRWLQWLPTRVRRRLSGSSSLM